MSIRRIEEKHGRSLRRRGSEIFRKGDERLGISGRCQIVKVIQSGEMKGFFCFNCNEKIYSPSFNDNYK
jgi:hypothetical protein